ncbi:MAG: hypothetical protein WCR72_19025 [Bacteroidota bacterium]
MTKDNLFSPIEPDYQEKNQEIQNLKNRVDSLILRYLQYYPKSLCQQAIVNDLSGNHPQSPVNSYARTFLRFFDQFYEYKKILLNGGLGLKDYKSFRNSIVDYEYYYNITLTLTDVNDIEFCTKYVNFLAISHTDTPEHKYTCKGNLTNNTIIKRFQSFKTFLKWLEIKEIFTFSKAVKEYENLPKGYLPDTIALNLEEINEIKNCDKYTDKEKPYIDLFICNCFLGLAYVDLKKLDKTHLNIQKNGTHVIRITRSKSGQQCEILLWSEVKQDDCYIIAADGWKAELYITKQTKKETIWDCDLVPKTLVIDRYYLNDKTTIANLESDKETIASQLLEMEEEQSGEEGYFADYDKVNKLNAQKRLKDIDKGLFAKDNADEIKFLKQYLKLIDDQAKTTSKIKEATGYAD